MDALKFKLIKQYFFIAPQCELSETSDNHPYAVSELNIYILYSINTHIIPLTFFNLNVKNYTNYFISNGHIFYLCDVTIKACLVLRFLKLKITICF